VIAASGFAQPATYAEVFRVLGRERVLPAGFAASLEPMARVHELLRTRLADFDRFAEALTSYLDGQDAAGA
jgi:uncharacterized protein YutE (UPF0331/DUF86 family)